MFALMDHGLADLVLWIRKTKVGAVFLDEEEWEALLDEACDYFEEAHGMAVRTFENVPYFNFMVCGIPICLRRTR